MLYNLGVNRALQEDEMKAYVDGILKEKGMTEAALASKMGISRQSLSLKLKGKRSLLFSEAISMTESLGIELDDLKRFI